MLEFFNAVYGWRGKPLVIRCDNDPEYLSDAITQWAAQRGVALNYIQPRKPQQNAYVERFNRTVRYEWLSQYYWDDLAHFQQFVTRWMWQYNHERPSMGLGGIAPKQRLIAAAKSLLLSHDKSGGITTARPASDEPVAASLHSSIVGNSE
jgi:putative transposase